MKVLFVSSGNTGKIKTITENQVNSLISENLVIDSFLINGKGLLGYLSNLRPLRRVVKKEKYDLIHAHYSLSGFIASFAANTPLVVSLMGSDVKSSLFHSALVKLFSRIFGWSKIIVKSEDMKKSLDISSSIVIPNGVDNNHFKPIDKSESQNKLGWNHNLKHILFAANPSRPEKNYLLAKKSVNLLNDKTIVLHVLENIAYNDMVTLYNASDIVLLTSLWEGSPNVIKEAMACNKAIVATNVGDIKWLFGDEEGHFLTSFEPIDVAEKIKLALKYIEEKGTTIGKQRIVHLKLDSDSVAKQIINVYRSVLK